MTLTVGREAVVDFTLEVGAVADTINVTGDAPLVQTANATVAALVDERAMRELPLNGRSFADLTGIQPGVTSDLEIAAAPTHARYNGGGRGAPPSPRGAETHQTTKPFLGQGGFEPAGGASAE